MNTRPSCTRVFKTPQGLAGHIQFKHPTAEAALTRRTITRGPAVQRPVSEELETLLKAAPNLFFIVRSLRVARWNRAALPLSESCASRAGTARLSRSRKAARRALEPRGPPLSESCTSRAGTAPLARSRNAARRALEPRRSPALGVGRQRLWDTFRA